MTDTRTISPEDASELYELDEPGTVAGPWTFVGRQHIRTHRWFERYCLVVKDASDDTYWGLVFDEGLTEAQENNLPWEASNPKLMPLTRLYPHEVRRVEYRTKPQEVSPDAVSRTENTR